MKIKQLRLNDFGIFDQQTVKDIHSNIVVIGGYNRSGKTTLMQALRYMGYGFPKDRKMAYKRNEYNVSFDVTVGTEDYRCVVEGYREPKVYGLSTTQWLKQSLYPIDPFTYRQLFTLDINQLKPVPDSVQSKEKEQLKSILLGAGLKELTILPKLLKEFDREAYKIGATKGDPTTKQFSPYTKNIDEQEKKLTDAIKEVDRYHALKHELQLLQNQISKEKQTIDSRQSSIDYLNLLKNHHDLYDERQNILTQLELVMSKKEAESYPNDKVLMVKQHWGKYKEQKQELASKLQQFSIQTGRANSKKFVYLLIKYRDKISTYYNQLSGLRTRLEQWEEEKESIQKTMFHAQEMLQSINEQWKEESLDKVKDLPLDDANRVALNETINHWREVLSEKEKQEASLKRLTIQIEAMNSPTNSKVNQSSALKQWVIAFLIVAIGGLVGVFSHPFYGLLVGVVGGLTLLVRAMTQNKVTEEKVINRRQRQTLQAERVVLQEQIQRQRIKEDKLEAKIDGYRDWLRIDGFASLAVIEATFTSLQRVQMECYRLTQQDKTAKSIQMKCNQQLNEMIQSIQVIDPVDKESETSIPLFEKANQLMLHVEELHQYCQPAIELSVLADNVSKEKEALIQLTGDVNDRYFDQHIEQWLIKAEEAAKCKQLSLKLEQVNHQIIRLFENDANLIVWESTYTKKQVEPKIEQFSNAYNQYFSLNEIEDVYTQHQKDQEISKELLKSKEKESVRLQQQIEAMATDSKIFNIQQKIDQSRSELKPLAYRYAVLRTAEYLLNRVEVEMLHTMKETLLKKSSDIFKRITNGEYRGIYPANDLMSDEFGIINQDNQVLDSAEKMSRGTMEQLYLAVRLSRIKEIEHSLPVIIDDSFVNFDAHHIRQTITIINELSQTHQVFIMTCHSALVKQINDISNTAQFYQLERGVFNESTGKELAEYLAG